LYPIEDSEDTSSSDEDPMIEKLVIDNHKKISKIITKNNILINKIAHDKW